MPSRRCPSASDTALTDSAVLLCAEFPATRLAPFDALLDAVVAVLHAATASSDDAASSLQPIAVGMGMVRWSPGLQSVQMIDGVLAGPNSGRHHSRNRIAA